MRQIPNWYVITGGPSSGKTTVINELRSRGYNTVPESARNYLELQLVNGRDIEEVRLQQNKVQHNVLNKQMENERNLDPQELTFLDRALPDSLAYYQYLGLNPDEKLLEAMKTAHYKKVFILDLLPMVNDAIRQEDLKAQRLIHQKIIEIYKGQGEEIIHVALMSPKDRADFILSHL